MTICNDCNKYTEVGMVLGCSEAVGEYYRGAEICEHCIKIRREIAIAEFEMIRKGTLAWAGVPDNFIDELRGGADEHSEERP